MDCFGPFLIKRGRKEHKRYGLIFICFYSQAIHIEMLEDTSTDSFINTCFINLRGAVRQLHCDQGRNFVGARNEFKEALKQCDSKEEFLAGKQCEFIFSASPASHAGGVWEHQIRTIQNVLNATLPQSSGRLYDASPRTLLYEAIAILNSRPLTVDGINNLNSFESLTFYLILKKSKVTLPPPGEFECVNDMVSRKEDILPRNQWQSVRVVETVVDSDGLVR